MPNYSRGSEGGRKEISRPRRGKAELGGSGELGGHLQGGDSIDKIHARVHALVNAWNYAGVRATDSLSGTS